MFHAPMSRFCNGTAAGAAHLHESKATRRGRRTFVCGAATGKSDAPRSLAGLAWEGPAADDDKSITKSIFELEGCAR